MVSLKNTYFRSFLIFEREDPGFGDGMEPSGYIKLEGREGQGKLIASVQNLKEEAGKLNYRLYLLCSTERKTHTVQVGLVPLQRGRAELKWEYDIENVAGSGIPIHDFNIAIILAEYNDRQNKDIICPLAAYRADKVAWRGRTLGVPGSNSGANELKSNKTALLPLKQPEFDEEIIQKQEVFGIKPQNMEEPVPFEKIEAVGDTKDSENKDEVVSDDLVQDSNDMKAFEGYSPNKIPFNDPNMNNFEPIKPYCPQGPQTGGANPCMNCYLKNFHHPEAPKEEDIGQNLEKMKKSFDKYFNVFDPFNSKRRDYKWWKVDSPVNLNNILYQCNIRTPLLFNPSVMMAHFKFRHLSIGIYSDRVKRREYLVCGVPGVFGIDTKPFGDMCKWVQLEGNSNRYGAFGYWIVYIDPKSGKFLNV